MATVNLKAVVPPLREALLAKGLETQLAWRGVVLAWDCGPDLRGLVLLSPHGAGTFDAAIHVRHEPTSALLAPIIDVAPSKSGLSGTTFVNLMTLARRNRSWEGTSRQGITQLAQDIIRYGVPWVETLSSVQAIERHLREPMTFRSADLAALLLTLGRREEALGILEDAFERASKDSPVKGEIFGAQLERARALDVEAVLAAWKPVR